MNVPSAWLQRLPSPAPLAWFALFQRDPLAALDALLWESLYLDHDHPLERDDLLSNWVALIGDAEGFTALLDRSLADWINANWGKLRADTGAPFHARVWSAVLHTVHLCSPHMQNAAQALLTHFPQRVDWLGRWSAGPGLDPLGALLLSVTGYQTTRLLAPLWQRMVHLPDGIPVHHAGIALEGILQLPPEQGQKPGVFRNEFAHALVDFATALSYRAQRGDLDEKTARTLWLRLKRSALMRMPFEAKWKHDIALMFSRMEAQAAGAALTDDAKQKVLAAPMNLRKRFPDMEPVYWLEHGLAYHALTDGQVRLDAVAESFEQIKLIANQQVNPHDPDALYKQGWAAGVMRLTGAAGDPQALAQRISEHCHQLDVREEEPVLRREAAWRWQPVQLDSH